MFVGYCKLFCRYLLQIAKIGFSGMKRLNRVQSVVFDTAYGTNENLLICAPTGAGKTNVAMLTILREIKQNVKQGVVMKDKFKVRDICGGQAHTVEGHREARGKQAVDSELYVNWTITAYVITSLKPK